MIEEKCAEPRRHHKITRACRRLGPANLQRTHPATYSRRSSVACNCRTNRTARDPASFPSRLARADKGRGPGVLRLIHLAQPFHKEKG
ncbi:hypothetical protein GCM10011574_69460 [Microbispora bryophytorum]|uniref:Uncharacterized protein n=1 Tax=Microbispora bryophytorum TaxID=1460882 RepID=A0A8H9H782_9ACTN|nr:hypothetical protein GCM10011574_69460 [Microbispora bryophytorum]